MSGIPYCDRVLEVTGGCTKCSPGCQNCWAIKEVWRLAHNPLQGDKWKGLVEKKNGVLNWTGKIKLFPDALEIPLRRKKPTTYFVDSKADLFHKEMPFSFTDRFFDTIYRCPQHTFLIFTKRIEQALSFVGEKSEYWITLPNVQFFLSISTQKEADEKIPILLRIPAAVRGLSIEPMLGEIDLTKVWWETNGLGELHENFNAWVGIQGVILGGESGPGARPMHPDWVRNIRDQCIAAGVPFFFKQWGAYYPDEQFEVERKARPGLIMLPWDVSDRQIEKIGEQTYYRVGKKKAGRLLDGKEWNQLPARK